MQLSSSESLLLKQAFYQRKAGNISKLTFFLEGDPDIINAILEKHLEDTQGNDITLEGGTTTSFMVRETLVKKELEESGVSGRIQVEDLEAGGLYVVVLHDDQGPQQPYGDMYTDWFK